MTVGLDSEHAEPRVFLPHQTGPQEQTIDLPVGEWLVDWPDSQKLERLEIRPGTRPHVALATTSGACELKANRCELLPGIRERRIRVREGI